MMQKLKRKTREKVKRNYAKHRLRQNLAKKKMTPRLGEQYIPKKRRERRRLKPGVATREKTRETLGKT